MLFFSVLRRKTVKITGRKSWKINFRSTQIPIFSSDISKHNYIYMCVCVRVCVRLYVYICVCVYLCISVCVCVCVWVSVHVDQVENIRKCILMYKYITNNDNKCVLDWYQYVKYIDTQISDKYNKIWFKFNYNYK